MAEQDVLSEEEIQQAIILARKPVPFTKREQEELLKMLAEWHYLSKQKEERNKGKQWLFATLSLLVAVVGIVISALLALYRH